MPPLHLAYQAKSLAAADSGDQDKETLPMDAGAGFSKFVDSGGGGEQKGKFYLSFGSLDNFFGGLDKVCRHAMPEQAVRSRVCGAKVVRKTR